MTKSRISKIVGASCIAFTTSSCAMQPGPDPVPVVISGQFNFLDESAADSPLVISHKLTGRGGYLHYQTPALAGETRIEPDGRWSFSGLLCPQATFSSPDISFQIWNIKTNNLNRVSIMNPGPNWELDQDSVQISLRDGTLLIDNIALKQIAPAFPAIKNDYEADKALKKIDPDRRCLDDL